MNRSPLTADEMHELAIDYGINASVLCQRAGVYRGNFIRWKAGGDITLRTYTALAKALDEAEREYKERSTFIDPGVA